VTAAVLPRVRPSKKATTTHMIQRNERKRERDDDVLWLHAADECVCGCGFIFISSPMILLYDTRTERERERERENAFMNDGDM
jgi:hypothetical protein